MRRALPLLLLSTLAQARTVEDAPPDLGPYAVLAPAGEPGERLVVEGTLVGAGGKPLAGAVIYAYHTDARGSYGAEGDPAFARLYGFVRTGPGGRFTLRTIVPGPYPSQRVPAHIHVEVAAGGKTFADECWFAGDPFLDKALLERERARGPLSRVLVKERAKEKDGGWVVRWKLAAPPR